MGALVCISKISPRPLPLPLLHTRKKEKNDHEPCHQWSVYTWRRRGKSLVSQCRPRWKLRVALWTCWSRCSLPSFPTPVSQCVVDGVPPPPRAQPSAGAPRDIVKFYGSNPCRSFMRYFMWWLRDNCWCRKTASWTTLRYTPKPGEYETARRWLYPCAWQVRSVWCKMLHQ